MIELIKWTDRQWSLTLPVGVFPALLERLRGTPARAAEILSGVPEELSGARAGAAWSAKDHIGHLTDLDELDQRRLAEFLDRITPLSVADPENRRTEQAGHGTTPSSELVSRFRRDRDELVRRMELLSADQLTITARHTRLGQDLRLIDWAFFVAEHDDHHLAHARRALRAPFASSAGQTTSIHDR